MVKNRFLRRAYGDDQAATTAGVKKFLHEVGQVGDGVIVVPSIKNVGTTMLATALGEPLAKRLIKDRSICFADRSILLCSDATLRNFSRANAYLALWSSKSLVDEIEGLSPWRSLTWVTWLPKEADEWEKKHRPTLF